MYRINLENKNVVPLEAVTFVDMGARERFDIQEWIDKAPEILEGDEDSLLILAKEHPVNQDALRGIRSDLLALDRSGTLVVIELKRDDARGDIDWQAIKYAARYSRYGVAEIVAMLAERKDCDESLARKEIIEHIVGDVDDKSDTTDDGIGDLLERTPAGFFKVRIIMVAREFHPDVACAALWLRDSGVEVSCVRLKPYIDAEHQKLYLVSERIIPLPETADYIDIVAKRKATGQGYATEEPLRRKNQKNWSSDVPTYADDDLRDELQKTLNRNSNLTPRLMLFLKIIVEQNEPIKREDMKGRFVSGGIANDVGLAGTYLSNISQFINKRDNGHLRQIIEFSSEGDVGQAGAKKDDYRIREQYRELVKGLLQSKEASVD